MYQGTINAFGGVLITDRGKQTEIHRAEDHGTFVIQMVTAMPGRLQPELKNANIYCTGQVLFDAKDPTKVLARTDEPFFSPELPFEKSGQYVDGTVFVEGLVRYKHKWYLYYGCADSFVGVATAD